MKSSGKPLTHNKHLLDGLKRWRSFVRPIPFIGERFAGENKQICAQLVKSGTFIKLNEELWPGCYYARSERATSPASKIGHLSAPCPSTQPVRQTTGSIRLR